MRYIIIFNNVVCCKKMDNYFSLRGDKITNKKYPMVLYLLHHGVIPVKKLVQ